MSAYVVDPEHISYLLQAAISRRHGLYYGAYPNSERIDTSNASRIGAELMAENIASVSYRYEDSAPDDLPGPVPTPSAIDFEYRHSSNLSLMPVNILKAISGYEYQSCEHPGWHTSNAKAFCDRLRSAAIASLDGYDDSDYWSVTSEMARPDRAALRAKMGLAS